MNDNKIEKQFKDATKHVLLTVDEKRKMKESLVSYMKYKPIRNNGVFANKIKRKNVFVVPFFRAHHFSGAFMIAALVITSTFGVSFAAGDALPGDLLYGVKVNINEEIKTALLPESKRVSWERERAERRLEEASKLVLEGKLDAEKKEKVSKLFEEHTKSMVEHVRASEETDPVLVAEVASEFKDSMEAHEAVLAVLAVQNDDDSNNQAKDLIKQVQSATMEVEKIREDVEEKINFDNDEEKNENSDSGDEMKEQKQVLSSNKKSNSANLRERAAYRAKDRAKELENNAVDLLGKFDADSDLYAQAKKQIDFGKELVALADEYISNNNLSGAYNKYREASVSFQKVVQLLNVADMFSVEIYTTDNEEEYLQELMEEKSIEKEEVKTENDDVTNSLNDLHKKIEDKIKEARSLLLNSNVDDKKGLNNINKHIENASAYLLRGEIAIILKDYKHAEELYDYSYKMADRSVGLIRMYPENLNSFTQDEEDENTTANVGSSSSALFVTHEFKNGIHTYSGASNLLPCAYLNATATIATTSPYEIVINIKINKVEDENCMSASTTTKDFSVNIEAPFEAYLSKIYKDDTEISFEINEIAETDSKEVENDSLFDKAIKATQEILH